LFNFADAQMDIKDSWFSFINDGTVTKDAIRPEILRSWQRCRNLIEPFAEGKSYLSQDELMLRKSRNLEMIKIAWPIMKELGTVVDKSMVLLSDAEGFLLEVVGNNELLPVGICCQESVIGTNCIGTVLIEGKSMEIKTFEHFRHCLHFYNSVGVPIKADSRIIGVLSLMNAFHDLSPEVIQLVKYAATTIGMGVEKKTEIDSILDCVQYGLFVVDGNGRIINLNYKSQELLGINRNEAIAKSIGDYIPNYQGLLKVLGDEQEDSYQFIIKNGSNTRNCSLRIKEPLKTSENKEESIILFTYDFESNQDVKGSKAASGNDWNFFSDLIGESDAWMQVKELGRKAAKVKSNILIIGESGTGKELLTQAIHQASDRNGPLVPINCGVIPKELLQSEFFGYEEGAFTGAKKGGAVGKFEMADGGTVFLDEIGEMPLDMQVSLLRFLQDRTVIRVGGNKGKKVDIWIIAATNRDLEEAVDKGLFREDLYYRLNVINIKLPPLRSRKEDIPLLVDRFIKELLGNDSGGIKNISQETMAILQRYNWPGNVRELRNVIEHGVVFAEGKTITPECLPQRFFQIKLADKPNDLRNQELQHINKVLEEHNGNISKAARALGITRSTLYRKIEQMKTLSNN
jgi:transcriptional regulator with PAS, ATPase and Fis domain